MALFVETATTGQDDVFGGGPETRFWGGVQKTINLTRTTETEKTMFFSHEKNIKKNTLPTW